MKETSFDFPAQAIVAPLCQALAQTDAIVAAPPGAGKSTVLPLALLSHFPDKRIVLMQPRRVVVRNLALFLASQLGEEVGQQVGYRIRGENRVSEHTRLEIITEGILSRRIEHDPELSGVDIVIFDEFHERSIHSDYGLALALEVQQGLRDDLRLVVMSATLDTQAVARLLPAARVLSSEGKMYPVEEVYTGQVAPPMLHQKVADYTALACTNHSGDVLVFLPGAGAINKVTQLLTAKRLPGVVIHSLYGALDKATQQLALDKDPQGRQKIILATNIAETSLTIANIAVVVDSGLENIAQFHPASGLTQLQTQMISQASATQRKGRAGRLGPGICYRLWAKEQQDRLARYSTPQILREDSSMLYLSALGWGTTVDQLALLDKPGSAQLSAARSLLLRIGAIDNQQRITPYGRKLVNLPCHPRLAHMLLQAQQYPGAAAASLLHAGVWIAALSEDTTGQTDGLTAHDVLSNLQGHLRSRLQQQAKRYWGVLRQSGELCAPAELAPDDIAAVIALAYDDLIAYRTGEGQWKMANGKGADMPGSTYQGPWLAVLKGQQIDNQVYIRLAQPVNVETLKQLFPHYFSTTTEVNYHTGEQRMQARKVSRFQQISLLSEPVGSMSAEQIGKAWYDYLLTLNPTDWPLDDTAKQWLHRLQLAATLNLPQPQAFDTPPPWPAQGNPLTIISAQQLVAKLGRCKKRSELAKLPWVNMLHQALPWSQQHALDTYLPTSMMVPSGFDRPLVYQPDGQVILAVKMQEMFGSTDPLFVGQGRQPVTLSLLSPAGRPLQMTADLGQFWQGSYQQIKKEMKGRYPKHPWPDDPTSAPATTRTKRAMR